MRSFLQQLMKHSKGQRLDGFRFDQHLLKAKCDLMRFFFFFSPDYFKHDLDHRKQSVSELSPDNPSPDYTEQLQEAMN